ncbi:MAG TPA: polysaccharide deacetylase family protein [Spongiibacteraceae bacterium]|nr:polysaccharide deacetylase family protein [Spongiibacteraceae bacterium]
MNSWRPTPLLWFSLSLHACALILFIAAPHFWLHYWPQILAAIALNHLLLAATGLWPRSTLLGSNWIRLPEAAALRGEIALTIDDGPDPEVTPQVLDILDRHGARATFFCIGERAQQHASLCREIVRRGHAVENHSLRHRHTFSLRGYAALRREIKAAQTALGAIAGSRPQFFRAPAGLRNPFLDPVLTHCDLQLAAWTRRGFDTRTEDAALVLQRLTRDLNAGDILLLHDGHAARTADGTPIVVAVLPELLARISAAGLTPVTLRAARAPQ